MRPPKRTTLLLVLTAAAAASADTPPEVRAFFEEAGRAHRAQLNGESPRADSAPPQKDAPLWRERRSDEDIPDFSPPTSLAPLIRSVRSGVVNISTVRTQAVASTRFAEGGSRSVGSGFVISPDGHVVTNSHVVEQAQQIRVKLADGREYYASVVGRDPSTDVALLKLAGDVKDLPVVFLGDSDRLEIGDWVLAIGNPFGLDHSASHGMISAKERIIGVGVFDDFIQTDALINPGNSGGPLFNMRGEVVGVNTAIVSQGQGIGFAVPINMVKDLLPNLKVNGRLARGWLGVTIDEQPNANGAHGAVVTEVFQGSPAAKVGLQVGDRVLAVNGRPIETYLQLLRRIAILAPGSETRLAIQRDGGSQEVTVRLGERPTQPARQLLREGSGAPLGMVLQELNEKVARSFGLPAYSGILVAGVIPGSAAEQAGLRVGDVVVEVNRKKITDDRSFAAAMELSSGERTALLRVRRGDSTQYLAVRQR